MVCDKVLLFASLFATFATWPLLHAVTAGMTKMPEETVKGEGPMWSERGA